VFHHTARAQRLLLLAAIFLANPCPSSPQASQMPTAATNAVVKSDALTVFSEMDASSTVAGSLKKGDSVYVDLRIDQSNLRWCGVRVSGQSVRLGFVDCRSLERVGNPHPTGSANAGAKSSSSGSNGAAAEVPLARPSMPTRSGYAAVQAQVIKDGVIDTAYIVTCELQAKTGGPPAVTRAALAHFAAGEFEISQHDLDQAIEHFAAMESFAGNQTDLLTLSLLGRGYALLLESEFSAALDPIERARKISPQSAQAAALAGWAHYRLNQTDAAVADLQTSLRLHPDPGVAHLLAQVMQDKDVEGDFRDSESSHFVLRYHGGAGRQLASEVIRTLEDQFQTLRNDLHYSPPEPIGVILYTQETFRDVTRVPGWTGAVNDGRIRVPVQGMDSVSPELARVLKHELTHSFVFQKTSGRCPTWLQEGLAQWMEGRRTGADAASLVQFFEDGRGKQLRYYDGSWMHLNSGQARYAYAWALAVVETIEAQSGQDAIDHLLDAERSESSPDAALLQGLRTDFSALDDATVAYLRQTYLQ
jgi:tetratricopeptide (TPR) repeat protein